MTRYRVVLSRRVAKNLIEHVRFISKVNTKASERFVREYEKVISRLGDDPYQFQVDTSFHNVDGYRRAVFAKWYKCLFIVDGSVIYVDSVVDCRRDDHI
ncbi:hypothetical protein SAMN05216413_1798 [Ruminococcaceae bacterium KH2T8]|nr:hypothetical protein SAMN05216413_1798 [Ruminococcaceae bacterium KH2T8]